MEFLTNQKLTTLENNINRILNVYFIKLKNFYLQI